MQAGQAVTAGYFGGYSAKMQDVGGRELELMQQALERKAGAHTDKSVHKEVSVICNGVEVNIHKGVYVCIIVYKACFE